VASLVARPNLDLNCLPWVFVQKLIFKFLSLTMLCLGLGACALDRGTGLSCSLSDVGGVFTSQSSFDPTGQPISEEPSSQNTSAVPLMVDVIRQTVRDQAPTVRAASPKPVVVEVLSLSAGGQYGSFGAGFLRGWAENPTYPRPDFDLVTGVSAGGMLAPVAFSGSENDAALDTFRGLDQDDVFRRRPLLSLASSPAFFDVSPLEKTIKGLLNDDLIEDVAQHHRDGAKLLVMAVNLDNTRATVFDLGEIAAGPIPIEMRRDCLAEIMLASSAIPGVFPPRNIGGQLYADGGLRDQIFLQEVESARVLVARETGRPVQIKATIVINGSLRPPPGDARDSLLGYAERSLFTLADEILRDSIIETLTFADANENWEVQGVLADLPIEDICPVDESAGTFSACVTTALFDSGRSLGRSTPIEFMNSQELRDLAKEF